MGFSIELSEKFSKLRYCMDPPILLDPNKDWEICLTSFVVYNSINNVTTTNNKIVFINDDNTRQEAHIPPGTYELKELINQLKDNPVCQAHQFNASIIEITRKVKLTSLLSKIDFTVPNTLGHLLGFSKKRILEKEETAFSDSMIDIFPVNTIRIRCNLIESNYENGKSRGNIVYSFPLHTPTGEKIVQIPPQLRFYPLNSHTIKEIYVEIVDQDDRLINFEGETITMELYIKEV